MGKAGGALPVQAQEEATILPQLNAPLSGSFISISLQDEWNQLMASRPPGHPEERVHRGSPHFLRTLAPQPGGLTSPSVPQVGEDGGTGGGPPAPGCLRGRLQRQGLCTSLLPQQRSPQSIRRPIPPHHPSQAGLSRHPQPGPAPARTPAPSPTKLGPVPHTQDPPLSPLSGCGNGDSRSKTAPKPVLRPMPQPGPSPAGPSLLPLSGPGGQRPAQLQQVTAIQGEAGHLQVRRTRRAPPSTCVRCVSSSLRQALEQACPALVPRRGIEARTSGWLGPVCRVARIRS